MHKASILLRRIPRIVRGSNIVAQVVQHQKKKGLVVKMLGRTNRTHSKLVRDFSKKLLTGIFGCPKLHVGQKKLKKKNSYFFHFS